MSEPKAVQRLTDALDAWFAWRANPTDSREAFLAAHDDLRELLEPLLADDTPATATEGREFGEYRLVRELGRGGMGIVHEAVQRSLGRRVALKVLGSPAGAGSAAIARFRRESELLARLHHAHIVPVYDAGLVDGVPFHAMELVDGCALAAVVAALAASPEARDGGSLARALRRVLGDEAAGATVVASSHVAACLNVVLPIARALAAAHEHGIVHRDVKPANVLLRRDGTPLLTDFGLARDLADASLSRTGEFAGTPHYVSPEQARGDRAHLDGRTDVFSLAVVAYELLFAARPFDGTSTEAVLDRVRNAPPPRLRTRQAGLPADLVSVLDKALQKDPADRYATMADFAADLEAVFALRPVRARRRGPVTRAWQAIRRQPLRAGLLAGLGVAVAVTAGLSVYVWSQQGRIAAATAAERLPRAERLLETMLLHQDFDADELARQPALDALALMPDLPEAVAAMAVVQFREGDVPGMRASLARLREIAPDVALQMEQREAAPEPSSALGWFIRGMLHMERGHETGGPEQFRDAANAIRRAMTRAPQPRALFHGQYLHALMHLRDAQRIREVAADTIQQWPDSAFASYWCGFALQAIEPSVAIAHLERAIALAPDVAPPVLRLAKVHEIEGRWREAHALYAKAQEMAGAGTLASLGLCRALRALGRNDEALLLTTDLAQRVPRSWRVHMAHGDALFAAHRRDEAIAALRRAVALGPTHAHPRAHLARALVDTGRPRDGLAEAEAALALDPGHTLARSVLGNALLRCDRPADAVACFREVTKAWPDGVHGWKCLAMAHRRAGQLDDALVAAKRCTELGADHAEAWLELGKVHRARNEADAAGEALERAIAGDPEDGEARINLAGVRLWQQRPDEAVALLAEARAKKPSLREAWKASLETLASLGRPRDAIAVRVEYCHCRPNDRSARLELIDAVLGCDAAAGDGELLARAFAELAGLDGSERDDVKALRERAADRLPR